MKKTIMMLLVSAFMFGGMVAYAQTNEEVVLPDPGLTPDSPFYFLDQLFDNLRVFLAVNPEAKAKVHLEIANERLAELRVSIKNKKDRAAEKARELYEKRAQRAQDEAEKSGKEETANLVKESYLKHIEVLKRVREEAPEQARKGLDRALENAERLRAKKIGPREKNTVTYSGSAYSPASLTIKKGETVTWTNASGVQMWTASAIHPTHKAYPATGGCIGSAFDACQGYNPGSSWSFTFDEVGTWTYHDHLNPKRTGKIVVE